MWLTILYILHFAFVAHKKCPKMKLTISQNCTSDTQFKTCSQFQHILISLTRQMLLLGLNWRESWGQQRHNFHAKFSEKMFRMFRSSKCVQARRRRADRAMCTCVLYFSSGSGLKEQIERALCGKLRVERNGLWDLHGQVESSPSKWDLDIDVCHGVLAVCRWNAYTTPLPLPVANYRLQGRDAPSLCAALQSTEP